jgi:hypothetical protein
MAVILFGCGSAVADYLILADSSCEFSGTQGQDNWYYGYYVYWPAPYNVDFRLLPSFDGWQWYIPGLWTALWDEGGHPEDDWPRFAVRRWVSEVAGPINITGRLAKINDLGGDGIRGYILVDGQEVWSQYIAYNDRIGVNYTINVNVNIGSLVDFAIGPAGCDTCDGSAFTAIIYTGEYVGKPPGLVAHYEFEGNAKDSSGNNHHGMLVGDAHIFRDPERGNVLSLDGNGDYVRTNKTAADLGLLFNAPRTITAWVYTRSFNDGGIYDMGSYSQGQNFSFRTKAIDNWWRVQYWAGDDYDFHFDSKNRWVHFAHVHTGSRTKIYANGDLIVDVPRTLLTTNKVTFRLGTFRGRYFDGRIDDVRIYNTALSDYEIKALLFGPPIIHYVDADATGGNDGSSWADAFNDLQDGLAATWSDDEIWVAQGIYKPDEGVGITPGDRTATFHLKNGVTIKGGYAGFGEPDPNARDIDAYKTILSGDLLGNDGPDFANNDENSYRVLDATGTGATALLDEFIGR